MDGTWKPNVKKITYMVCPSCKELMKRTDILKLGCIKCGQI
jgi:hypothetical protein